MRGWSIRAEWGGSTQHNKCSRFPERLLRSVVVINSLGSTASSVRTSHCLTVHRPKDIQPGEEKCVRIGRRDGWGGNSGCGRGGFGRFLKEPSITGGEVVKGLVSGWLGHWREHRMSRWDMSGCGGLRLLLMQRGEVGVDMLHKAAHVRTNVSTVEALSAGVRDWYCGLWRLRGSNRWVFK